MIYRPSHVFHHGFHTPLKTATFWSRRPFRIYTQQEIFYFRGLSDFGHFSPAMARDEIVRIGPPYPYPFTSSKCDKTVWPGTPWPTLSIRNYICCVDSYTPHFKVKIFWPGTKSSRNTMLPLYSLVWGQKQGQKQGNIILKGLSHQTFIPPNYSNFLICEAI